MRSIHTWEFDWITDEEDRLVEGIGKQSIFVEI